MNWRDWFWTLRRLLRLRESDTLLDEEIRAHLAMETQRRIDAGEIPDTAHSQAVKDFGNVVRVKETTRGLWTFASLDLLWQDARYAVRTLRRSPSFTVLALSAVALGIGATTAMFTTFYSIVLKPLPFASPDRLVTIWERPPASTRQNVVSLFNFKAWKERAHSFEAMAAYNQGSLNLTGSDEPVQVTGTTVTADLFRVLGVPPRIGRVFSPGEDGPGAPRLAILTHGLWQRRFGGRTDVLGNQLSVNGAPHKIIGVMPPDFAFPNSRGELLVNLRAEYSGRDFSVIARLRPGATLRTAQDEMTAIAAGTAAENPGMNAGYSATVTSLHEQTVGQVTLLLKVLFAAVVFVLLIACANVANLLLMRSAGRHREMAVRLALGAGRWRIAHQLLVESLVLSGGGGLLGVGLAQWGLRAMLATLPADFPLPRIREIAVDSTILWFAVILSVTVGLIFGMAPLFSSFGATAPESLRSGARSVGARQRRFRQIMVAAEVAIALILLIGAGLMTRSFVRLSQIDPGFRSDHLLTVRMNLLPGARGSAVQRAQDLLRRVRALPQVISASSISILPLSGFNSGTWYYRADRPEPPKESRPGGDISIVMPGYFQTMGIPMVAGRDIEDRDGLAAPHVGVLNRTAARMLFGNEDPVGKHLTVSWNDAGNVEIIGVAADVRHRNLQSPADPCLFLSHAQMPFGFFALVIRTASDTLSMTGAVKEELRRVDPNQGIAGIQSMEERIEGATTQSRVQAWLISCFGLIALILSCIGIYGSISYAVRQRTREIGVRVALGADRLMIFGQVLREGLVLAIAGAGIGAIASLYLTPYLKTLLFQVEPVDAAIYAAVILLLLTVASVACYFPSRRAATIDPVVALRDE
jgi:putative ABC transport system permease protein